MDLPRKRKRGTILTFQGLNKLEKAIKIREYSENNSKRFTLDHLSSQTGLDSHTLCKIFNCNVKVDKKSLVKCFKAFNLVLEADDYQSSLPVPLVKPETHSTQFIQPLQPQIQPDGDYNLAPKVSVFYGRTAELATLNQWIQVNRCQLIMVLGMGGMGKTSLIAKLMADFTNSEFKYVIWRFLRSASLSLHHAPTVEETLTDLIHILSHQQAVDLPKFPDQLISKLMQYLHQTRCLLVLDNLESILQWGGGGYYRPGFEGYGQLIRTIGESTHKSCLIIISREPPIAFSVLEKKANSVKLLILKGLLPEDGLKIFQSEGIDETQAEWQILHNHYGGNPLMLKIVVTTIHFLFSGKIDLFLAQGITVFGDIYDLLDQQFQRLSDLEKTVIYSLAIHRQTLFMPELLNKIIPPVTCQKLLGTLESLKLRSLIECNSDGFTVQNNLREYVTSQFES